MKVEVWIGSTYAGMTESWEDAINACLPLLIHTRMPCHISVGKRPSGDVAIMYFGLDDVVR